jgi:hypothetical protein
MTPTLLLSTLVAGGSPGRGSSATVRGRDRTLAPLLAPKPGQQTGSKRLKSYVDVLVAFEDTDEYKPSAAPQLEAMRLVGATDGLGVGDLPTDIAAFRAAGFPAIAVTWGYGVPEALVEAGADCVCADAAELEHEVMTRLSVHPGGGRPSSLR